METESLEFKIVMDDGQDTEVLGRLKSLRAAHAAFDVAVEEHPKRNVYLKQGAHVIAKHEGGPKPPPAVDPNLKDWSVHLIGGRKMEHLGFVLAIDETSAMRAASEKYTHLSLTQVKRLVVKPARP